MKRSLMCALVAVTAWSCASAPRSDGTLQRPDCPPSSPVAVSSLTSDSAALARIVAQPLAAVAAGDSLTLTTYWDDKAGLRVWLDSVVIADSVQRETMQGRVAVLLRNDPATGRHRVVAHLENGAVRMRARTFVTCRPVLINQPEIVGELQRAQRSLQRSGVVSVWLLVDETGVPSEVRVDESSGDTAVDALAVGVARVMRFTPAMNDGRAVRVWVQMPIEFRMQ